MTEKQIADIFKGFCDENRIKIIRFLKDGEKCACKLLENLNITQPTLSHHMKILVEGGLVLARKEGKWTYYSLCKEVFENARCFIEEIKNQVEYEKEKKMTDKEMQQKILNICKESTEKNPIVIFNRIVKNEDVLIPIHGPIHHVVDGAVFLTAFFNAGGKINLEESFWELCNRAEKMPGGMCGHWGVCGAVTSVGAALSIIKKSGPLSEFDWGNHILYSSKALEKLGTVGGPRCCKRNAYLALDAAIDFVNENKNHFGIVLEKDKIECSFSVRNPQCIKERCPFATR